MRCDHRKPNELRPIKISRNYTKHAEGSVLIEFGSTKVLCNASIVNGVPKFLKDSNQGWLTTEYSMLPRSTHTRIEREAIKGKQAGRSQEIQRLIGRALRAVIDLSLIKEHTVIIDCDVIQADGGTRTAAITGGYVALVDAINHPNFNFSKKTIKKMVAAVSVGIVNKNCLLDLDYHEDSTADTDMNIVMTDDGNLVEVQATAERQVFSRSEFLKLLDLAQTGIDQLLTLQKDSLQS